MKSMKILGMVVNDYDTSSALVQNGRIIAAAQEERFCGEKHTRRFPTKALFHSEDRSRMRNGKWTRLISFAVVKARYMSERRRLESRERTYLYAGAQFVIIAYNRGNAAPKQRAGHLTHSLNSR